MKRKAIQLANNTLVVSLPAKWVQLNKIAKGADLDVDMKESILIVKKGSPCPEDIRKARLDISGMPSSLIWSCLNAVYRAGFNEIEIFFSEPVVQDIKGGGSKKTMDILSRITDKLIGMEIIRQSKNSCTLKEITQLRGDEFGNVINRIFLSLMTVSKDIITASKANDKDTLDNIYSYSEVNINKLSDYCMRILNNEGLRDFKESNSNYLMTFLLEEVGDAYAWLAKSISAGAKTSSQGLVPLLERADSVLELSHKFFLNPKKEYYVSLHEARNRLKKDIDAAADKKSEAEARFYIKIILDRLMEVNNAKLTEIGGF